MRLQIVLTLVVACASCDGCDNTTVGNQDGGTVDSGVHTNTDSGSTIVDGSGVDVLGTDQSAADGSGTDAGTPVDAARADAPRSDIGTLFGDGSITRLEYCEGEGPPIIVSDQGAGGVAVCTGDIAQVTFAFAICSCESPTGTDELFTDAFDSTQGEYLPGGVGGSVGTNGSLSMTNKANIGGSLWMSGTTPATFTDELHVAGALHAAGDFTGALTAVGLDAWVGGDVIVSDLTVTGELTVPSGNTVNLSNQSLGGLVRAPVSVAAPCRCDPGDLINIAGFVEAHRNLNDNAEVSLDPDALSDFTGTVQLDLPCGRFFLNEITGTGNATITIQDRTALFVGGDIGTTGELRLQLADGAEVDLFVQGGVTSTNVMLLGSERYPAKVRLYVGGSGSITFTGNTLVAGNFYAPLAEVIITNAVDVYGSIFARKLTFTNKLRVHYDRAVLSSGQNCGSGTSADGGVAPPDAARPDLAGTDLVGRDLAQPDAARPDAAQADRAQPDSGPPPPECVDCYDCGLQACIGGQCGSCTDDAQCCPPLLCWPDGVCAPMG